MKVKDKKAFATLTDVKNKIGDVFSMVDKHGEVIITSYNKPAYTISAYKEPKKEETSEKKAAASEADKAEKPESKEEKTSPAAEKDKKSVDKPTTTPPPAVVEEVAATGVLTAVEEVTYEPETQSDLIVPEVTETAKSKEDMRVPAEPIEVMPVHTEPTHILANTTYAELWNRNNANEQAWVQKSKDLL